ncbi:M67 family metallopeptidase [Sphingomonas soli]|uniref:M67 family metallopeptidase n=1 Tax=Sphingomonas soli TaxID=266127 RepID=UPI00082D1A4C|nr:M67 family metallopeptidase [Sphingomonas soli]
MRVEISRCVVELIQREAEAAAPLEACGLLFGEEHLISGAEPCANVAEEPDTRFEIDPAALFAALRAERAGGRRIAGYWHSHPSGEASPSATDVAMAQPDGKLWLIAGGGDLTAWRATRAGLERLKIELR